MGECFKMIQTIKGTRFNISLFTILSIFTLTFFIYNDFEIRMVVGYSVLMLFLLLYIAHSKRLLLTATKRNLLTLAVIISILIVSPYSRTDSDTIYIALSLNLCTLCAVLYKPNAKEISKTLNLIVVCASFLAGYVILIYLWPDFYWKFIKPILSSDSQRVIDNLLADGYGIAIGGNVVLIDYILMMGFLISLSTLLVEKKGIKGYRVYVISSVICFVSIVLENRKSELLAAIITIIFLVISKTNFVSKKQYLSNIKRLIIAILLISVILVFLAFSGYLERYLIFFGRIIKNLSNDESKLKVDISSGRLKLWGIALDLFISSPIIGIGWGRFSEHISGTYNVLNAGQLNNVHNNYLQLLCETGIIGFILVATPIFSLYYRTIKRAKSLKQYPKEANFIRIMNSTSLGLQLFFLLVSFLDPCWYKMVFWCFYTIAIILSDSASIMERKFYYEFKTD